MDHLPNRAKRGRQSHFPVSIWGKEYGSVLLMIDTLSVVA